jgi:hypothetical protein
MTELSEILWIQILYIGNRWKQMIAEVMRDSNGNKIDSRGNDSFKLVICCISWRYKLFDNINKITRRKTCTRSLLCSGQDFHKIAKEARKSRCDTGIISNKAVKEKTEGIKQQDDAEENLEQIEQHLL